MVKKMIDYLRTGKGLLNNKDYQEGEKKSLLEVKKKTSRTEIINYLLSVLNRDIVYLEIGVRNPNHNFNLINAKTKYGVDPGVEFEENPVEFKMTSDDFFSQLKANKILTKDIKFDGIFIDGLHLAEQVNRDIENSLSFIKDDGFIILHDCNPPTEWHAREEYRYPYTPAGGYWNGTTWKAFLKYRSDSSINSCCIDSDWGVGILSKTQPIGTNTETKNEFYDYNILNKNRAELLNLISFDKLKTILTV